MEKAPMLVLAKTLVSESTMERNPRNSLGLWVSEEDYGVVARG